MRKFFAFFVTLFRGGGASHEASAYPIYGQPVEYAQGRPLVFPDFTLTYLGDETPSQPAGAPTLSLSLLHFKITDAQGNSQTLILPCGQTAPQPQKFTVGSGHFTLRVYQTAAGVRLAPHQLVITN